MSDKNVLKNKVKKIKKKGRALEIKFQEPVEGVTEDLDKNDLRVSYRYQELFFPLDEEYASFYTILPNKECTFEKLGSSSKLISVLEEALKKQ